jgi:hypothetical protein
MQACTNAQRVYTHTPLGYSRVRDVIMGMGYDLISYFVRLFDQSMAFTSLFYRLFISCLLSFYLLFIYAFNNML